jgi:hypothetical protein
MSVYHGIANEAPSRINVDRATDALIRAVEALLVSVERLEGAEGHLFGYASAAKDAGVDPAPDSVHERITASTTKVSLATMSIDRVAEKIASKL